MNRKGKRLRQKAKAKEKKGEIVNKISQVEPATIGLSIIVKNEADVIVRMLETVYPLLDYWVVVDTGSTDGTQDIVRNFFKEKGIPGEVVDFEWIDSFGAARNFALEQIKGKADFGFWIDADEQLIWPDKEFNIKKFKQNLNMVDAANVKIHYGTQNYFRLQFFRTDRPWFWYGPIHEVLMCEDENGNTVQNRTGIIDELYVLVKPDGNSWKETTQQEKYEKHAEILLDYVENDPKEDPRWLFYLAQSYRDANTQENREKAIEWYTKRSKVQKGYWEEVYYSLMMVANLKRLNNEPPEVVVNEYLKCGKANSLRAEHLIPIIGYYQSQKEWDAAYIFSSYAMNFHGKNPFPKSSLFIDHNCYNYKIAELHSINCYYTKRESEAKNTFNKVLKAVKKGLVPQYDVEKIQKNKQYFIKSK